MCFCISVFAQKFDQTEILTLGSFHFDFPNRDVIKTAKDDQIDVLELKNQKEIEQIVARLAKFKPTIIVIEADLNKQTQTDENYNNYLQGKYALKPDEREQIGFRLAKMMNLKKVYCANDWGEDYPAIAKITDDKNSPEGKKFSEYFEKSLAPAKDYYGKPIFKQGITAELKRLNSPEYQRRDLGFYLTGIFKYETADNKNFGADFTTGWWFNRNLRIFRNIQRIPQTASDRIFVVFGAGHVSILNPLFERSPEYKLVDVNKFLK